MLQINLSNIERIVGNTENRSQDSLAQSKNAIHCAQQELNFAQYFELIELALLNSLVILYKSPILNCLISYQFVARCIYLLY